MRTNAAPAFEHYGLSALRYFLGGHALISGFNHFVPIVPEIIPKSPEIAARFMAVLIETRLYDLVKVIELVCGIALILGRYVPLSLALEMPISVIICYLSLFIAPTARSIYTGPREVLINAVLLLAYWGYFRTVFFHSRAPVRPLWRRDPEQGRMD